MPFLPLSRLRKTGMCGDTDFGDWYLLSVIFSKYLTFIYFKLGELNLIFYGNIKKDHKDTLNLSWEPRQCDIGPHMYYLPEQFEHMLKNVFEPFGKLLRISWTFIFLFFFHVKTSLKKKINKLFYKVFLQINNELSSELVFYCHTKKNFMTGMGNIPHLFCAWPPLNQKSSFFLNCTVMTYYVLFSWDLR